MNLKHTVTIGLFCILAGITHAGTAVESGVVDTLVKPYLAVQSALADDDLTAAKASAARLADAVTSASGKGEALAGLTKPAEMIGRARDIDAAREGFLHLTHEMIQLVNEAGTTGGTPLYVAHCPMAFDGEGGSWLQADKTIANPYFGAQMLRCGSVQEQLVAESHDTDGHGHAGHDHSGSKH